MADKKSPPNKPNAPESVAGKKPHATLDLKATEIKPSTKPGGSAGAGSTLSGKSAASSVPGAGSSAKPADKKAATSAAAAAGSAKPDDKSKTGASPKPTNGGAEKKATDGKGSAPPKAPPPKPASSGSGIGRFFSLLLAGIVGGFLALLGADSLQPQIAQLKSNLGLPAGTGQSDGMVAKLADRIAALEKSQTQGAPSADSGLAEKLAAAEKRIGELEALKASVDTLQQSQEELGAKTAELSETAAKGPTGDAIPEERIAKLEQQLATMSAFAESNQNSGLVPRLAALTGRMADLEETLKNQIAAVRAGVGQDVESRLSQIAESSEAARSGTQRMDRQLSGVANDTARLGQQYQTLKADTTRLGDTLRVVQEETATLSSKLEGLTGDVTAKISKLASPGDIAKAVSPVAEQVTNLESKVANVVSAEQDRKQNAKRIVLSLELANLERAIERGDGFASELAQVKSTAGGLIDVSQLEQFEASGVAPVAKLQSLFRPVAHEIIEASAAPAEGSVFDQLLANARSVVKVRKVNHGDDDKSPEAVVSRIETALGAGRLADVLALAKELPDGGQRAAASWLKKVEDRHAVDVALGAIGDQLKASLSGTN
ncbi:MAG: hypothetical protein RIC14_06365 [Filomicrobium sp.]